MIALMGATALIHSIWALRIWWPIADEARLARTVVGTKGITQMPSAPLTWAVVAVMLAGIAWAVMLAGWSRPLPAWMISAGGWIMAAILLVRGAGTYVGDFFGIDQEPEFRQLNQVYFSPLILALGLGTVILILG